MESQDSAISPAKADADKSQERSTIDFPYVDLDNAVEVVKGVHNAGGTACDSDQLAAQLQMEAKGGGFRSRIGGAQVYKLITYERGGRVLLTDLGRQLVDPETERQARMNAFLAVELYAKVYEEFKGGPLPPHAALERALEAMGVGAKVKDRARQVMLRSAKQAGFFEHATDRLIKPSIKNEVGSGDSAKVKHNERSDGEQTGGNASGGSGSGSGGGDYHPFIEGLLQKLPKPDTEWPFEARKKWLLTASNIFDLMYQAPAASNNQYIEIELKEI